MKSGNLFQHHSYSKKKKKWYNISYIEDERGLHVINNENVKTTTHSFEKFDTLIGHEFVSPFFNYSSTLKRKLSIQYKQQTLNVYEFICNSAHSEDSESFFYYLQGHGFVSMFNPNFDANFRITRILNTSDTNISSNMYFVSNYIADSIESSRIHF